MKLFRKYREKTTLIIFDIILDGMIRQIATVYFLKTSGVIEIL